MLRNKDILTNYTGGNCDTEAERTGSKTDPADRSYTGKSLPFSAELYIMK